jgi:hypothetical protein
MRAIERRRRLGMTLQTIAGDSQIETIPCNSRLPFIQS